MGEGEGGTIIESKLASKSVGLASKVAKLASKSVELASKVAKLASNAPKWCKKAMIMRRTRAEFERNTRS
ncbi:hypothetical protein ABE28_022655 [Peribacillus muralis]|uniref:Uncharacterized protein n=1 Tax=Peribacillus muralis TaxID=264697 RepID=A0A1B3XVB2_9BACI|nr:hypothetical protein [Peribacillus muralis]AOH57155.1 hypothetical protein ABE28_022655 [Peribacillus muralis]